MFDRIVVGTDGSETAAEAVAKAVELAKLSGASLNIVSAYQPQAKRRDAGQAPTDVQYELGPREDVNLVLDGAAARARKEGVEVQTHAVEAEPADAILNVADDTRADLIVVGNKGMTGARRFLLGSVPNNVSHHAPCSVMIIQTV